MDGLLTLTDEELEQTDLHFLIHGWAFYPGVLLTPEEWTAHGTEHYMIYTSIGERTRFDQPDGVTPHGYGTYVLTLELPEDPAQYGLELPEIYSAYRLYLNGNLELQVGEPDLEHYQPRTQNRMVTFTGSGFTTILLAVRDDSHFYSGLVYPPALGTPLAVNLSRGLRLGLAVCVTLCGVLGAALAAYFGVRMRHKNALLFALLCLAGSLFTAYPILHSAAALPPRPWYALEISVGYAMVVLVVTLQNRLCQTRRPVALTVEIAGWLFCLTALCYGLLSPYLTIPVMKVFSLLIFCFKIGSAVYLLGAALRAVRQQVPQAAPLFFAAAFYATLLLWDRLLPAFEPVVTGWFGEWGSFAMTLTIGYVLWRDIVSAYRFNLPSRRSTGRWSGNWPCRWSTPTSSPSAPTKTDGSSTTSVSTCVPSRSWRDRLRAVRRPRNTAGSCCAIWRISLPFWHGGPGCPPAVSATGRRWTPCCNITAPPAQRQEIRADLALTIPAGVPLGDVEWCTVLGNLLENALEACQRQSRGERRLSLTSWATEGTLFLLVENTYDGWFDRSEGHILSRKAGGVRCGIGLSSVRETVERHGGTNGSLPRRGCLSGGDHPTDSQQMMNTQIGKEKITVTHPQTYSRLYDFFLADAVAAYHGGIDVDAVNEFVEHTLPYIAKVARTLDVISIPLSIFFCLNLSLEWNLLAGSS